MYGWFEDLEEEEEEEASELETLVKRAKARKVGELCAPHGAPSLALTLLEVKGRFPVISSKREEAAITRAIERAVAADAVRSALARIEDAERIQHWEVAKFGRFSVPSHPNDSRIANLCLEDLFVPLLESCDFDLAHIPDLFGQGYGVLHAAAAAAPQDALLWLAVRLDVDARTRRDAQGATQGLTPLHIAAARARFPAIQTLIACGADVTATDRPNFRSFKKIDSLTPLMRYHAYTPKPALKSRVLKPLNTNTQKNTKNKLD
ncbi:hypothetical protein CTAYLR_007487 [Chrysophaeum taylorii]|uniref:Uncharacterized protein n=1 Tax=Chrysophaeum taylorii TaxID=2483200 RepID=A0AAD7UCN0_9STRA|nr:hypothetical protein CTAYLR_007487 [Chrysophaeum taylorii]